MNAIETRGLRKTYGRAVAVEGLDLTITEGTVFGLLGPNGSGKTTTILMLMGLTEITAGTVRVLGMDPMREPLAVKRSVGYMPDTVGFYDDMNAIENLRYSGKLAGLSGTDLEQRITKVLARVRLADNAKQEVKTYSRGMRQRLGLADVMLKHPRIAILDEPTNGLDPQSTHEFLDMIRELKQEGLTILLSSHLLDRVQAVCDRVGLFHRGKMMLEGTVPELARQVLGGGFRITVETAGGNDLDRAFAAIAGVNRVEAQDRDGYRLHAETDVRAEVVRTAQRAGADVLALAMAAPSLDDVYTEYFHQLEANRAAA